MGKVDKRIEGEGGYMLIGGSQDGDMSSFTPAKINADGTLPEDTSRSILRWVTKSDNPNITYIGEARIGSDTDEAAWKIGEINETNGTLLWSSDLFNNIWDNRESLTYN